VRPAASPIAGVVDLNPPPFCQLARDVVPGCRDRDLSIERVWAASRHNQVDGLALETGIDGKCSLWVKQGVLGIY
jgi:hypothetical protein